MRPSRFLVMGLAVMSMVNVAQAAVYVEANKDIQIHISEDEVVTKLAGEQLSIVGMEEDVYLIENELGEIQTINKEDVTLEGIVTTTLAEETKVREAASPSADIKKYFKSGEVVIVLERQDEFYKIKTNDTEGYIYKSQIDETNLEQVPYYHTEEVGVEEKVEKEESTSKGEGIVTYAKQFLGGRYVYGGNNLNTGVDCSGFTQQVMKKFGITISRSSRSQFSNGVKVAKKEDLKPGDLVFYGTNGRKIDHVALYAGNGQIIHASDAKTGIKMSNLYYGKPIIGYRRVI